MTIRPIRTMINHSTTEVFFDDLRVPAENLVGEEGKGFRYILEGMNAERILIAAECIGDARFFLDAVRRRKDTKAWKKDRKRRTRRGGQEGRKRGGQEGRNRGGEEGQKRAGLGRGLRRAHGEQDERDRVAERGS